MQQVSVRSDELSPIWEDAFARSARKVLGCLELLSLGGV